MPLTRHIVTNTKVYEDPSSKSGWSALADVTIAWDCVPPQDTDTDYDAEVRAWIEHLLAGLP